MARSIIGVLVVSYLASVAILYWQRDNDRIGPPQGYNAGPRATFTPPAATGDTNQAALPAPPGIPLAPVPSRPAVVAIRPVETAAPDEAPVARLPLPIAFHIWNRRAIGRIEGDVTNGTSAQLLLTLRAENPETHTPSEISLSLAPGEKRSYSTDDGLAMQSGDTLTLHSGTYMDRVVRVP